MPDPASPGDDDADTRTEGVSNSDADDGDIPVKPNGSDDGVTDANPPEDSEHTEDADSASAGLDALEDITGIGPTKADALREVGFTSVADIRAATPAELSEARGIGETLAGQIANEVDDTGEENSGKDADGERDDDGGNADAETVDKEDAEVEPVQDGGTAEVGAVRNERREVEPVEDDVGGLLGYGQAGGPEADEEMPLTAHIEEMIKRLVIVALVAGVVSLLTFPFGDQLINFLWNSILPTGAGSDFARPRLYSVLEFWFTKVKVASLAGVIVGLPVFVYQTYRFMRPGLYPNERRYYLAAVPTSLVLALVGVAFAYFIVLPSVFTYFLYYSEGVTTIGFALGRTFNLILIMMAYLAVVFQIPLFILLAMLMGLVTREWLAQRRLIFWGAFLGISFVFSPDPTGMVPILITLTMIALFEGTLLLTRWTQRRGGGGESGIGA
jgi:sec-independent protein translocase protein TatC